MKNKEERIYIKQAIWLTILTKEDKNFSEARFDEIIRILKEADKRIKNLNYENN